LISGSPLAEDAEADHGHDPFAALVAAVQRSLTSPRPGLELDGRFSTTSVDTLRVSPGHAGWRATASSKRFKPIAQPVGRAR